jgi:acyl-CoA synthetase (AMP-forming)/AMP-acid ligase II
MAAYQALAANVSHVCGMMPHRVLVIESLPHGATGKLPKTELRRMYPAGAAPAVAVS